jgi:predicted RNase H-like HicB family nuclease
MRLLYRVGLPGWKIAAKLGTPLLIRILIVSDQETGTYWANSPDLDGLVVSGTTLDEVTSEAIAAGEDLLSLQLDKKPHPATARFTYQENALCAA